jgi:hypothetical protein
VRVDDDSTREDGVRIDSKPSIQYENCAEHNPNPDDFLLKDDVFVEYALFHLITFGFDHQTFIFLKVNPPGKSDKQVAAIPHSQKLLKGIGQRA